MCEQAKPSDKGTECRCDAENRNVVGLLCNEAAECPPHFTAGRWTYPPGFPDDECFAACTGESKFNCTSMDEKFRVLSCRRPCEAKDQEGNAIRVNVHSYKYCDGILECTVNGEDEANCSHRHPCKAGRLISIEKSQLCDGIEDCDDKTDKNNVTCPHRFFCKSRNTKISMGSQFVCDFNINCDDNSDEIKCSLDERFYCESGTPLFVRRNKVLDGRGDCADLSDECPASGKTRNQISFSSIYHLIANPILRGIVWVMGLLALFGNGAVLVGENSKISAIWKKSGGIPLKTNLLLILNLALADFLMSVYLLMLGIAGILFDGDFCLHEMDWLTSNACTAMGVLVAVSSEASVMTMVFLSSYRIYCVTMPFKAKSRPAPLYVLLWLGITWLVAFSLALIPLSSDLEYMFTEYAILKNSFFFQNTSVRFDSAKIWASKLLTYSPELSSFPNETFSKIMNSSSWKGLKEIMKNTSFANQLNATAFVGYYSANSVCIPRLFVTRRDRSWQFSLATTIFNFLAFVYVASTYVMIVFHQRKKDKKEIKFKAQADQTISTLQRKIFRLITTDFCCWVSISIMSFIHVNEDNLPSVAYEVSAIVLLPINSALNPLLYSDFFDKLFVRAKRFVTSFKCFSKTEN